jgi:hypothetical protein
VVDSVRGKALADEYRIKFLEISAKSFINVENAFITLTKDIKKRLIDTTEATPIPTPVNVVGRGNKGKPILMIQSTTEEALCNELKRAQEIQGLQAIRVEGLHLLLSFVN